MRTALLTLFTFVLTIVFGQNPNDTAKSNVPVIYGDRLKPFIDSLKNQLLIDTVRFRQTDLIFIASGRRNAKPYSPLFIVGSAYIYKLDIVSGSEVAAFAKEILDDKKIKYITYIDSSKASEQFGQNAWQGVILITMYDKAKFNPKVAGLTLRKNKSGDNFTVRKSGEILIRD
jgi:hypothetical protein